MKTPDCMKNNPLSDKDVQLIADYCKEKRTSLFQYLLNEMKFDLRKYRAIKVVSWRVNFSTDAIADFEGLLAVNREICKQQMSEKAPPDVPPYCAVFP